MRGTDYSIIFFFSGSSQDPQLEDVEMQFHALYMGLPENLISNQNIAFL
jgi:hypothetical protein